MFEDNLTKKKKIQKRFVWLVWGLKLTKEIKKQK